MAFIYFHIDFFVCACHFVSGFYDYLGIVEVNMSECVCAVYVWWSLRSWKAIIIHLYRLEIIWRRSANGRIRSCCQRIGQEISRDIFRNESVFVAMNTWMHLEFVYLPFLIDNWIDFICAWLVIVCQWSPKHLTPFLSLSSISFCEFLHSLGQWSVHSQLIAAWASSCVWELLRRIHSIHV